MYSYCEGEVTFDFKLQNEQQLNIGSLEFIRR